MKYSIIIPTYTKYEEAFRQCLPSVLKFTDLTDTEIIVVANGSPDETWKLVTDNFPKVMGVRYPEGMGYAKAVNKGIELARGEYIILLNDDTILLPQQKNDWLEIMNKPFTEDDMMGLTAPMKTFSESANAEFLIFFCVMISRKVIDTIGLLDETFFSYGEDTDYCMKAQAAGFKIKQVPRDSSDYYAPNRMTGEFPIFHEGNVSHKNWKGGEELIAKNNAILRERYNKKSMVNINKAIVCDGFMSKEELLWLGKQAQNCHGYFIEIGSWHGRSSRAIADNLPEDGKLICIDTWNGSKVEQTTNHASAKLREGDHAFFEFCENMFDHIKSGKVIPLRMCSANAIETLNREGIKAEVIFIDAGHTYEEVLFDVLNWCPILKSDGTFCGHDYTHVDVWGGVKKAVDEIFKDGIYNPENTSIWVAETNKLSNRKPCVFDAFMFNNEIEILERRFETIYDVVDRFIICEAMETHGGQKKQLVFHNNMKRFEKYLNKVTYLVVEQFPKFEGSVTDISWAKERYQRDYLMNGLNDCKDDDIVIISDVDEIPSKEAIKRYHSVDGIRSFEMDLYYYNEHTKSIDKWSEAKILPYGLLKQLSPCGARYTKARILENGGVHLSYFGGADKIMQKIKDTAHQEYNNETFYDKEKIERAIKEKRDLFHRDYVKFEEV